MRFATVAATILSTLFCTSLRAEACINAVEVTQQEALARIFAVDAAMRLEQYWFANLMIPTSENGLVGFMEITDEPPRHDLLDEHDRFDAHLVDAQRVIEIRWGELDAHELIGVELHFLARFQREGAPRFTAWRAEALALLGSKASARELLRELERRDLMPDAHAYATLATLTTGAERRSAVHNCRVRAVVESICPSAPTTI